MRFARPAFLPWFRMGNMRGWGGPITTEWLTQRKDLQIKILASALCYMLDLSFR